MGGIMAEFLNLLNIKMNTEQCIYNIILVQSIKGELSKINNKKQMLTLSKDICENVLQ